MHEKPHAHIAFSTIGKGTIRDQMQRGRRFFRDCGGIELPALCQTKCGDIKFGKSAFHNAALAPVKGRRNGERTGDCA